MYTYTLYACSCGYSTARESGIAMHVSTTNLENESRRVAADYWNGRRVLGAAVRVPYQELHLVTETQVTPKEDN